MSPRVLAVGPVAMRVTVYLDIDQDLYHTSYVYAGLFSLAARGDIELEVIAPAHGSWRKSPPTDSRVCFDVHAPDGGVVPVAVDLRDRGDTFDARALENAAVYFKRSHYTPEVDKLETMVTAKVLPFGMNFVCANAPSARAVTRQILTRVAEKLVGRRMGEPSLESLLRKLYDFWRYRRERDYTAAPNVAKTAGVLFQTRIWEDHEARWDDAKAINDERVCVVRVLKERLGDRFYGGLVPTPLAIRDHPDLVTPYGVKPIEYTKLQKSLLVGVYTRGLHHSTAWKLGEYFAASMCVVADPPRNQLPVPLTEGVEFVGFAAPEDCATACLAILDEPVVQQRMRQAAYDYYVREISPEAHLRSCLARALAHQPLCRPALPS